MSLSSGSEENSTAAVISAEKRDGLAMLLSVQSLRKTVVRGTCRRLPRYLRDVAQTARGMAEHALSNG